MKKFFFYSRALDKNDTKFFRTSEKFSEKIKDVPGLSRSYGVELPDVELGTCYYEKHLHNSSCPHQDHPMKWGFDTACEHILANASSLCVPVRTWSNTNGFNQIFFPLNRRKSVVEAIIEIDELIWNWRQSRTISERFFGSPYPTRDDPVLETISRRLKVILR